MTEALVQINNVVKHYTRGKQTVEVLHGITLAIPKGDFVALMGPSGSGKTTLLNLLGGLDSPTSGSIVVDGEDITRHTSKELAYYRGQDPLVRSLIAEAKARLDKEPGRAFLLAQAALALISAERGF